MLYTDERLKAHAPAHRPFYKENNISVALPVFTHEKELVGVFCSSARSRTTAIIQRTTSRRSTYTATPFRDIAGQLTVHGPDQNDTDRRPRQDGCAHHQEQDHTEKPCADRGHTFELFPFEQLEYGGDYFDSYALRSDTIGVIMADTADAGVDSAILALQFSQRPALAEHR